MAVTQSILKLRRDTAANWTGNNSPVLAQGEIGIITDETGSFYIGDGQHTATNLNKRYTTDYEKVQINGTDVQASNDILNLRVPYLSLSSSYQGYSSGNDNYKIDLMEGNQPTGSTNLNIPRYWTTGSGNNSLQTTGGTARGDYSVAIGLGTTNSNITGSFACGTYNDTGTYSNYKSLVSIGNGHSIPLIKKNALAVNDHGCVSTDMYIITGSHYTSSYGGSTGTYNTFDLTREQLYSKYYLKSGSNITYDTKFEVKLPVTGSQPFCPVGTEITFYFPLAKSLNSATNSPVSVCDGEYRAGSVYPLRTYFTYRDIKPDQSPRQGIFGEGTLRAVLLECKTLGSTYVHTWFVY